MIKKITNNLKLLWFYRELLINLAKREITVRYKQSILGYAWVIINPLFQILVISFVFSTFLRVPPVGVPFIIFISVALLPWTFFSTSITSSTNSLVNNSTLITKIYFPREILIYSTILAKMVDFALSLVILVGLIIFFQIPINLYIIWVPIILLIQIVFTTGISLILSALNLFYRDIQYILTLILTLWFYVTPIAYPTEVIPEKFKLIFSLNPMAVIVNAYREVIIGQGNPNINSLMIALITSIAIFIFSFIIFKKLEKSFADYV